MPVSPLARWQKCGRAGVPARLHAATKARTVPPAQALISTALASSCSRITWTPAVRSSRGAPRERAGEPGGDLWVRVEAGERAGERW